MVAQRVSGVPLEIIVGYAEFHGLRIIVATGVFVPRRRTEFLVDQALAAAPSAAIVVDMCCGSGAVAAALLTDSAPDEVYAVDIDPAAVMCARRNLDPLGGTVVQGDLFDPLPAGLRGRVDLLVANAPYVPTEDIGQMPPEARLHEPRVALDGGADGLDVQRRVIAAAPGWLAPGGRLLIETSMRQAPETLNAFSRNGFESRVASSDEVAATVVIGINR
jgi:release factor glutamine methyltransferase